MPSAKRHAHRALAAARLQRGISVLFLALAFFFQSYVAQTHIHGVFDPVASLLHIKAADSTSHKVPPGDDDANCPFCQAVVHAGVFSTPLAPTLLPPVAILLFTDVPLLLVTAVRRPAIYGWHQRAPPRD